MNHTEIQKKIKFLMADGTYSTFDEYQKQNGLKDTQISKYFKYTEPKFMQDIQDYGELIVCHKLMKVLDAYRELKMTPITINSFNRNETKQKQLHKDGFKAATFSPHVVKLAADCDTLNEKETLENVELVKKAAINTGIKVRIGYKQYLDAGQTFIHIDVCPEYYGKGRIWYLKKHPAQWEHEITW